MEGLNRAQHSLGNTQDRCEDHKMLSYQQKFLSFNLVFKMIIPVQYCQLMCQLSQGQKNDEWRMFTRVGFKKKKVLSFKSFSVLQL